MEYGQWPPTAGENTDEGQPWTAAVDWVDPDPAPPAAADLRDLSVPPAGRRRPARRGRRRLVPWALIGWLLMLTFVVTLMNAGVSYIDRVQRAGSIPVPTQQQPLQPASAATP